MEYSVVEKNVLDIMGRTNFKNMSRGEVVSYASKLGDLRPEVAKEILAQYPQFVDLMKTILSDYKLEIDNIISSDDKSIDNYYEFVSRDQEESSKSRTEFFSLLSKIQSDFSKCLENPKLTNDQILEILQREMELAEMANKKDKEIRNHEEKIEEKVNSKDSEKRKFNWKLASAASLALIAAIGIGTTILGGDFNLNLPNNKA